MSQQQIQYVGIDLHRRRSVIVRRDDTGTTLAVDRVDNSNLLAFERAIRAAGEHPDVVLEATLGWYWLADYLKGLGANVHLAHPLGNDWGHRRVKNDLRDAEDLVDLLRLGRLAEAYVAPPELRELRELVRFRSKCVALRSGLKAQIHGVLAKEGVTVPVSDLFGRAGRELLDTVHLGAAYATRVASTRELIESFETEIAMLEARITGLLGNDPGYQAIQRIPGVGPVLAAVFCAEIGDAHRFSSPEALSSWAGLTPRHRESDVHVHRGQITKQGSRIVRWAAVEAAQRHHGETKLARDFSRISSSHGEGPGARKIARVAVARKIVTLVYYGLRDGEIRCLAEKAG